MKNYKTVDNYFEQQEKWHEELLFLREIFLKTAMEESLKWGIPAYSYQKKNLAGLAGFKNFVVIWFHQGVFLKDEQKKLQNAQEKTVAMRQWRFHSMDEIKENQDLVLHYLEESIVNQTLGKEIKPQRKKPFEIPEELQTHLKLNVGLKTSFEALSNSKQREFAEYIAEAKRAETKAARLEKIIPLIHKGQGLNDKYK